MGWSGNEGDCKENDYELHVQWNKEPMEFLWCRGDVIQRTSVCKEDGYKSVCTGVC